MTEKLTSPEWHHPSHGRLTRYDEEYQRGGQLEERHDDAFSQYPNGTFRARLKHFTWAWFTLPMSTGGIALLLSVQPHTFNGLETIGKIVYIFDLVIFIALLVLMVTRFILYPYKLRASLTNPTESLFFATFLVSIPTLVGGMQKYGVPSTGPWLITTVRVLFWLYVAASFLVAIFQYWYLFTGVQLTLHSMTPAWLLPIFPIMLSGTVASLIAPDQPSDQRMPILVAGLTFQGLGFWTALLMYSLYIGRMMESGLPGPNLLPGMFIAVGPPSFTALALIGMAKAVPPDCYYFASHPDAIETVQVIALAFGIFIWSLSLWFFGVSAFSCILSIRKMSFHLSWWAFVFPNVGFTIAIISIGRQLESSAVEWVGSVLSVLLLAMYLLVFFCHARAVWRHEIMWPGKDEDKDE